MQITYRRNKLKWIIEFGDLYRYNWVGIDILIYLQLEYLVSSLHCEIQNLSLLNTINWIF